MTTTRFVDDFSVLLLDERSSRAARFATWLSRVTTKHAATPGEVVRVFDSSVAVACLSQSLLKDDEEEIRRFILNRNPYCQLVLLAESSADLLHGQHYDATVVRPIKKMELRTTVENRLIYGMYSAFLDEFYSLSAELVALDRTGEPSNECEREKLKARIQQVQGPLEQLKSSITHGDMVSLLESLQLHRRYLTKPARDTDTLHTSKYHPNSCPDCDLPWGVDHRNDLGIGFSSLGAYVWQCTRCNEITHGSGPSDRHIARR